MKRISHQRNQWRMKTSAKSPMSKARRQSKIAAKRQLKLGAKWLSWRLASAESCRENGSVIERNAGGVFSVMAQQ